MADWLSKGRRRAYAVNVPQQGEADLCKQRVQNPPRPQVFIKAREERVDDCEERKSDRRWPRLTLFSKGRRFAPGFAMKEVAEIFAGSHHLWRAG
jgi:hypothetical protein